MSSFKTAMGVSALTWREILSFLGRARVGTKSRHQGRRCVIERREEGAKGVMLCYAPSLSPFPSNWPFQPPEPTVTKRLSRTQKREESMGSRSRAEKLSPDMNKGTFPQLCHHKCQTTLLEHRTLVESCTRSAEDSACRPPVAVGD